MATQQDEQRVYLGFAERLDEADLYTLDRQYLSLGKVGGGGCIPAAKL